ncbi:MAG TPA: class I SAM-dependent methyltransferase [Albitalea sp.]|uniref:class I SAM-dependent DNA methyltransferase n=1 Tax=Piscinibacter sp. TaxID=1903157 RepID=UPI002ECFB3DF
MTTPQRPSPDYVPERFWEERYATLDLTRSGHRDLPEAYNRWLYRRKQAVLRRSLRAAGFDPAGKRVMEIGVGTGVYVDFWKRLGVSAITGLDISSAAIEFLRRQHPGHDFLKCDVTEPDAQGACGSDFDLVTALDVLYHVVDDTRLERALRNVRAALRPQGLFAIHDQFLHRATEHRGYIRWRSLEDWQRLLAANGFEIVSRTPIFFSMIQTNDCATPRGAARMESLWGRLQPWMVRFPSLLGATGYALDTVLGRVLKEGPSMELMLVRRGAS